MLVRKTICGHSFFVTSPTEYPYGNGCFDEEEPIHAAWCAVPSAGLVVDVGASFGAFTLPALANGCRLLAFEPSDDGARILAENVRANGWSDRCTIKRVALFDGGVYPVALHRSVFKDSYPAQSVTYSTLDEQVGGADVAAIKIDIEGGELGCLQGAQQTLTRCRPLVLIEDHAGIMPGHVVSDYPASVGGTDAVISLLSGLGYGVERISWDCNRRYLIARA